jgi:hypothetical protein
MVGGDRWERFKKFNLYFVVKVAIGVPIFVTILTSSVVFLNTGSLLPPEWVGIILFPWGVMLMAFIAGGLPWYRKSPSPAIYENGIDLVSYSDLPVRLVIEFVPYNDLMVLSRKKEGLWVKSKTRRRKG